MKNFSLSKISVAVAFAYATLPANADIQAANQATQVTRHAGIEVINIANPTQSGLSHNQYQKFNVDKGGAVLNNAKTAGKSELVGQLDANPNLRQDSAKVILNEVVSRNPSILAGQQEIFGEKADYVLANPNGIAVKGGGFINTSKASLVVGKAEVKNGVLSGFDVSGTKALTTSGSKNDKLEQLDLIAPVINIDGEISGSKAVNIIGGKNKLERSADGQLKINVQKATGVVLDGKVAGSIQADRIRIHSTDERATLQITGAKLNAADTVISAGNATFNGKVETKNNSNSKNYVADKRVNVKAFDSERKQTLDKTEINAEQLAVDVENNLVFSGVAVKAKQAIISGGNTTLAGQTTLNSTAMNENKSKGSWYRNDTRSTSTQTLHRTEVSVDDLTLVANKGTLSTEGAKLDAKNALFYAENGMDLKGKSQRTQQTFESNYRNETAKLKTGRNYVNSETDTFVATELNVAENLRLGGKGDVKFSGVKGQVDGNVIVESGNKVIFTSQSHRVRREVDDKEKYWGGIGGSNSGMASVNEQIQNGTDLTIKGLAYIDAKNGVQISGSRVLAGEGYVRGNQGKLLVDSVESKVTAQTASRQGTIFNITKARNEAYNSVSTAHGSTLKSEANLQLVTDKEINVVGSKVESSGLLNLNAKEINVSGAANHSESSSSNYSFGFSKKFEKEKGKMNIESLVNEVIDTWLDGRHIENPLHLFWNHRTYKRALSVTLGSHSEEEKTKEITHTASQLVGKDVFLGAKGVKVAGSELQANHGNVVINADKVQVLAQNDLKVTESKSKDIGLTWNFTAEAKQKTGSDWSELSEKALSTSLTLGGQRVQNTSQQQTAQVSKLSAVENVVITANKIVHQGSTISSQNGSVIENAENIRHEAAQTTNVTQNQNVKAGLTFSTVVDKKLAHNIGVEVGAEGGRSNNVETKNTLTTINSGKDIIVSGVKVVDVGTQYQAGENVQLSSQTHHIQAAVDGQQGDKMSAGAKIGVSANTSDFKSATLKVSASTHYEQGKAASETVKQANIQGKNVYLTTDNLNAQTNIKAEEGAYVSATNNLNLTQSTASTQKSGGGFNASVAVGGIVKGGAVIPSVDVSLGAKGENGNSQTAVMNDISAKQVVIQAGKNNRVQGTNINATDNVVISGESVHVAAGTSNSKLNAGSASASVGIGKGVSSVKAEGKFSANVNKETVHTAGNVNAKNLTITANKGVTLDGVQAQAENVVINTGKGNLTLNALKDQVHKTGVAASLALNGDVKDKNWNAKGGSASLDVNVVRNDTHTASGITANNVNLSVNGNIHLNGSAMNANTVNGTVTGDVIGTSATDKIKETAISLSASGSGKYTPYPAVKLPLALKKDWDKGAIAGIKADAAASVAIVRKQRGLPTNINAQHNNLNVGGYTFVAGVAPNYNYSYTNKGRFTTNLKEQYYKPWRAQRFGQ